jgi:hypothetical protein
VFGDRTALALDRFASCSAKPFIQQSISQRARLLCRPPFKRPLLTIVPRRAVADGGAESQSRLGLHRPISHHLILRVSQLRSGALIGHDFPFDWLIRAFACQRR